MSGIAPQGEGRADGGKGRDAMAGYRTKVGTLFDVAVSVIALDDLGTTSVQFGWIMLMYWCRLVS